MCGINPTGNRVLLRHFTEGEDVNGERKTKGGIILTEGVAERDDMHQAKGCVVALGPFAFEDEKKHKMRHPVERDIVTIARYAGILLKGNDGNRYRLVYDDEVTSILDGDWDIQIRG